MPTKTFFNLPEEKRRKLMEAIRAEVSRVPPDEVSINRIVKAAGIPRGSYYQYFEDKHDMLQYLMADFQPLVLQRAVDSLQSNGGDLFGMFLDLLDDTYTTITQQDAHAYYRNVLGDMRLNTEVLHRRREAGRVEGLADAIAPYVDKAGLDLRSEGDLADMVSVLLPLTGEAFARTFFEASRYEEVRARYAARLALVRRGFSKDK